MHAAAHALDGDGPEVRREGAHGLGRLVRPRHDAVAGVERERDARDVVGERPPVVAVLDEHAGLGLDAQGVRPAAVRVDERADAVDDPGARLGPVDVGLRHAGPERHRLGAEHVGEVAAAAQEVEPARAALGRRRDERRLVLGARVHEVARAGLDDDAEAELVAPRAHPLGPRRSVVGERVEVLHVEGERDAVVARVGEQRERVVEPVVGQAVGVVGVLHAAARSSAPTTCRPGSR